MVESKLACPNLDPVVVKPHVYMEDVVPVVSKMEKSAHGKMVKK